MTTCWPTWTRHSARHKGALLSRAGLLRDAVAIGAADGVFGVSFGALALSAHLNVLQACALSVVAFTGASQFAFVAILAAGGSGIAATASALVLGTRNTLYGLRVRSHLPRRWWPLRAQFVIDETTGMTLGQGSAALRIAAFAITAASVFLFWNAGTLVGALAGLRIGDPRRFGLDAAGPAVFLALLVPLVRSRAELAAAALSVVVTLASMTLVPPGIPVLLAGATTMLVFGLRRS